MNADGMAVMVPVPGGVFWVHFAGTAMIAASVSIIIKMKSGMASLILGALLVSFALTIHLPSQVGGDQMAIGQVLKDLGLADAAFFYSGNAED